MKIKSVFVTSLLSLLVLVIGINLYFSNANASTVDSVSLTLVTPQTISKDGTYNISGKLMDTTISKPLVGMSISFTADFPISIPTATTDSNGNYVVKGLNAPGVTGLYSIKSKFSGGSNYMTMSSIKNLDVTSTTTSSITATSTASQSGTTGSTLKFYVTPRGGSGIYSFLWNFADGSTSTIQNPTHTYSSGGTYSAKVTVTDNFGTKGSSSVSVTTKYTGKSFLALFLQFADLNSQVNIFKPNMDGGDMTRLRAQNGALDPLYVAAALSLPGTHGAAYISSADIVNKASTVKKLGFDTIEFNLESGLSPSSDNSDVVAAMKKAANAAHSAGLKFRATPSKQYTKDYGPQIAAISDYYNIEAQPRQDECGTSNDGFKAFVDSIVPQLRAANPNIEITVQVSTQQPSAPGKTLLQTMETCFKEVANEVDGVSVWYGNNDLSIVKNYLLWYRANY